MYIPTCPDIKFTQNKFIATYYNNPTFKEAWDDFVAKTFEQAVLNKKGRTLLETVSGVSLDSSLDESFDD